MPPREGPRRLDSPHMDLHLGIRTKLDAAADGVAKDIAEKGVVRANFERSAEALTKKQSEIWTEIQDIQATRLDSLKGVDATMTQPGAKLEIRKILTRLEGGPGKPGEPVDKLKSYVSTHKVNPAHPDLLTYKVEQSDIMKDLAFVRKQVQLHPENEQLAELAQTLDAYAQTGIYYHAHINMENAKGSSYTNEALKHMGRTGVFVLSSAATFLTGMMMIFNQKASAAPFLYGGLALLTVKPELGKELLESITDGNVRQSARQASEIVGKNRFVILGKRYGFDDTGVSKEWANAVKKQYAYTGDVAKNPLLTAMKKHDPDHGEADFKELQKILSVAKTDDARKLIVKYIEEGSLSYAK